MVYTQFQRLIAILRQPLNDVFHNFSELSPAIHTVYDIRGLFSSKPAAYYSLLNLVAGIAAIAELHVC